ncbi:MAG: hypothetical protein P9M03_00580 [Candidatus Theseobacter exili]|nr:hypothetical protein [Candidatus Theseobacter exili]
MKSCQNTSFLNRDEGHSYNFLSPGWEKGNLSIFLSYQELLGQYIIKRFRKA